jgi:hypothetical protein
MEFSEGTDRQVRVRCQPERVIARVAVVIAALAAGLVGIPEGYACSCLGSTPATYLHRSTVAFVGTVESGWPVDSAKVDTVWLEPTWSVRPQPRRPIMSSTGPETMEYRLAVSHVWKGKLTRSLVVRTHGQSGMCGIPFATGESYIVYAHQAKPGGPYVVGLCGGTRLLRGGVVHLVAHGQPRAVRGAPPLEIPEEVTLLDSLASPDEAMRHEAS